MNASQAQQPKTHCVESRIRHEQERTKSPSLPGRGQGRVSPSATLHPAPNLSPRGPRGSGARVDRLAAQRRGYLRRSAGGAFLLVFALCAAVRTGPTEKLPEGMQIVALQAAPASITLANPYAYAQLLVTGVLSSGERIDVTRMIEFAEPAGLVKLNDHRLVRPVAEGESTIIASLAGQTVSIPVKVSGQSHDYPVSFVRDVMPVMSKAGCNAGTCHGSANGKNGFKLSLRGYDPLFDHRALTDDMAGRRFNRTAPDQSLMLLKPSGGVPHVGGVVTQRGEPYYEILRAWIASGVKLDLDKARVTKIEVSPQSPQIPLPGMRQQVIVIATYADGTVRDVTAEAFLESSLTDVVEVDKQGLATGQRRGEASLSGALRRLVCRHDGSSDGRPQRLRMAGAAGQQSPRYAGLQQAEKGQGAAERAVYRRRVHPPRLSRPVGVPPQPDVVRAFLADSRDTRVKRDETIDRLIGSPEFVDHWTNKWADLLQVNRKFLGEEGAWAFRNWIRQALSRQYALRQVRVSGADRVGLDACESPGLILQGAAQPGGRDGKHHAVVPGRAVQLQQVPRPSVRALDAGPVLPSGCLLCPRRPEGGSGQFADHKVGGTAVEQALPLVEVVYDQGSGEVTHERTGKVTPPQFPYSYPGTRPRNPCHRAASNWPTGSRRKTIPISPRATSIGCGATCWGWALSSRSMTFAPAIHRRIPNC